MSSKTVVVFNTVKSTLKEAILIFKNTLLKQSNEYFANGCQSLCDFLIQTTAFSLITFAFKKIQERNENYMKSSDWKSICIDSSEIEDEFLTVGMESAGIPIFLGRVEFRGDYLPCKIVLHTKKAYVPYANMEFIVTERDIQICCMSMHSIEWIPSEYGKIPENAVRIGGTKDGEALYAGRIEYENSVTPGKIHPSHRCLYIPYDGAEFKFETGYEIMVKRSMINTFIYTIKWNLGFRI